MAVAEPGNIHVDFGDWHCYYGLAAQSYTGAQGGGEARRYAAVFLLAGLAIGDRICILRRDTVGVCLDRRCHDHRQRLVYRLPRKQGEERGAFGGG
jgi:hypothetical protein